MSENRSPAHRLLANRYSDLKKNHKKLQVPRDKKNYSHKRKKRLRLNTFRSTPFVIRVNRQVDYANNDSSEILKNEVKI
ncbi:MAG: hypothetical protein HQL32_17135 [Planctomycetes bacterium]|nr:hypothetical protein [Planctomycetota bacterium]